MDKNQIIRLMDQYMKSASEILCKWLEMVMPLVSVNWWNECVLDNLNDNQRKTIEKNGFSSLEELDLLLLLRITDKSWYEIRTVKNLSSEERECIRDMMSVRNNWTGNSNVIPGKDIIVADLLTIRAFFSFFGSDSRLTEEVNQDVEVVKAAPTAVFSEEILNDQYDETNVCIDDIKEMSMVYIVGQPSQKGVVMSIQNYGDMEKYNVFVNGEYKSFYTGQIAKVPVADERNWVDINTFKSYLTAYYINNPSNRNLYSLNSARIEFVPYQFRPALKLIHSDKPRILIADSVGVGKTIEAGLIIKELQARKNLDNVLIICPKPLVSERKWELEMKRFDEDFVPISGPEFRQIISDTDRDGEWPIRYSKAIIPYSVFDNRAYLGEGNKKGRNKGLLDLEPGPHFDLVIVDEAHHIRNGNMLKEKAFEYKCVKYFCDRADAVVMLTATPLQTSDNDLYTLLNLLRPDVIFDKPTFDLMTKPNAYITKAVSYIRHASDGWQNDALEALKGVLETQWGENVIAANPCYKAVVQSLHSQNITREERVKLISDVESLHSFNSMLNRTRRKDIQDFCIRRSYTISVNFTPHQREIYEKLLEFEQKALYMLHGDSRAIAFMMTTIKRQAASCIFGLAPHIRNIISRRFCQLECNDGEEITEYNFTDDEVRGLENLAHDLLHLADDLPNDDPKFSQMMSVIEKKQRYENNKIIIFSTFKYTLAYLKRRFSALGLRVEQVDGDVSDAMRQDMRYRFELSKDNSEAIDILLFTEVGSEGLDYQFCDMMINYDLPWNPMKIEQRIGRIDRRGQKSETISIYNVITEETVDADIYYRCLSRIGVFEDSIGECENILGEIATQIDKIAFDISLTEEERRKKLEQVADNEVRRMQELSNLEEEEKELFGFDLSECIIAKEIREAENPWITPGELQTMIERYFNDVIGNGSYIIGEGDLKQLRLSVDAREIINVDAKKEIISRSSVLKKWEGYLKGIKAMHAITFSTECAEKNRDAFFITPMHPLAKQAAKHFSSNKEAYIKVLYTSNTINTGQYYFSIYAWKYIGINPHLKLVVVCEDDSIANEIPNIIIESQREPSLNNVDESQWVDLEYKQIEMWKNEKNKEVENAKAISRVKQETLINYYRYNQRAAEQKIRNVENESIRRMNIGKMERAKERLEKSLEDIREKTSQTDIHSSLIAKGVLQVIR